MLKVRWIDYMPSDFESIIDGFIDFDYEIGKIKERGD